MTQTDPRPATAKDPVCGAVVHVSEARHEVFGHRDYCFCSENCRIQFIVDPKRYLRKARMTPVS